MTPLLEVRGLVQRYATAKPLFGKATDICAVDGIDLTSQDVAIEIQRGLDKDRWFLVSHIAA